MNQDIIEKATALRHALHAHPELAGQEVETRRRLGDFLRANTGLEVVDRDGWLYAAYHAGPERPSIAFRADFDALPMTETTDLPYRSQNPGVAHKCGHDGHAATLAAFAMAIDRRGAEKNIYLIFQHGEEIGLGAKACAALIGEQGIGEVFAWHNMPGYPYGAAALRDGTINCASVGMCIQMKGAPAHASIPEAGRNPAFAIAEVIRAIPGLIDPARHKGMVLCTVVHVDVGEEAYGMAAANGVLRLTCRGQFEAEMDGVIDDLKAIATGQAALYGLECTFSFTDAFPETVNHPESADKIRAACQKLEVPVVEIEAPIRGSEDFGHYTKAAKGAIFYLGAGEMAEVHTDGYDFPDALMPRALDILSELAGLKTP